MPRPLIAVILVMLAVIVVYFGVGSQLPERWRVETTRALPCAPATLQREVGDLSRWPQWCGMSVTLGPTTVCEPGGTPGTAQQTLTWRGSKGSVVLQLRDYDPARGLHYELSMQRGDGPGGVLGDGGITWEAADGGCKVTWFEQGTFTSFPARWAGWFGAVQEHVRQAQENGLGQLAMLPPAAK